MIQNGCEWCDSPKKAPKGSDVGIYFQLKLKVYSKHESRQ